MSRDWAARLVANAEDLSGTLAWAMDLQAKKSKNQPRDMVLIDDLWIDVNHRVAAAGQCVCTASYMVANGGPPGPDSGVALDVAHEKLIHSFEFPQSTGEEDEHLYNEVLEARESAKEDLVDALNLLKTEMALSNFKQTGAASTAANEM